MRLEILTRKLTRPLPVTWKNRTHYQVEAWATEDDQGYPAGLCWVFVPRAVRDHSNQLPPILDFIFVADHYRRKGIASRLIAACRERWPTLVLTEAISEGGAALRAKVLD